MYSKIGKANWWSQAEYKFTDGEIYRQKKNFFEIGITAGAHIPFNNHKGGLDLNIGYGKRFITEDVEYFVAGGPNEFLYGNKRTQDRLAGRVNFYIYLFKERGS